MATNIIHPAHHLFKLLPFRMRYRATSAEQLFYVSVCICIYMVFKLHIYKSIYISIYQLILLWCCDSGTVTIKSHVSCLPPEPLWIHSQLITLLLIFILDQSLTNWRDLLMYMLGVSSHLPVCYHFTGGMIMIFKKSATEAQVHLWIPIRKDRRHGESAKAAEINELISMQVTCDYI